MNTLTRLCAPLLAASLAGCVSDGMRMVDGHVNNAVSLVAGPQSEPANVAIFVASTRRSEGAADDGRAHFSLTSIGVPLNYIWLVVWSVAGIVALVAGMVWGAKLGVQFSIALVALKALPVLILGGFTSVPGAIIGGLIIGAGEKVSEVYLGPILGGGIENWFAYMLALVFLLYRPQGLFGEKIIERV